MCGDVFDCQTWGRDATGICLAEAGLAEAGFPQCIGPAPTTELSGSMLVVLRLRT